MAANKLNAAAKTLVRERIVAGDNNAQIRTQLQANGHPADLTDAAFTDYRADPDVRAALQTREMEALQAGLAQRAARIGLLSAHERALRNRLYGTFSDEMRGLIGEDDIPLSMISREWRGTLTDLSRLLDTPTLKIDAQVRPGSDALSLLRELLHGKPEEPPTGEKTLELGAA